MKKGKLVRLSKSANYRTGHGTTVTVFDLFHSAPVRKKCFNECLELEWIKQRMEAFALMHYGVSFSLLNDATGSLILQTHKSNSIIGAFAHLFGVDNPQELHNVSCQADMFQMNGYVGRKSHVNRNAQFVFVNNRLTLKTELHALINRVLSESIVSKQPLGECHPAALHQAVDKHDIYIIMITCPSSEYEITFNPRKTLLAFRHSDTLMKCVRNCLWKFIHKDDGVVPANFICTIESDSSPDVISCEEGTRSYGKGINTCNVCNNLQSITVRRAGFNYTEDVFDPTMFGAQNEIQSHRSSNSGHGCRTVAGPVSSVAFHGAWHKHLDGLICDNKEASSMRNMDVIVSEIAIGNTGSRSGETFDYRNCILSADDCNYRSERSSPTNSHSGRTQNEGDLTVAEISSNTGLTESNTDHLIQRSHRGTSDPKHKINTGVNEPEIEIQGMKSIRLLKSDDKSTKHCGDDVLFRDQISLGSHNSYSSMTCLKDTVIRHVQRSPSSRQASVQLAPLKKLKRRMTEEPSSQCSSLGSSLKSFKRNISNKARHELLGGLSHVREQLSMPNQQCAEDKSRLNQENKVLHYDDGVRTAEGRRNDSAKYHTSTADKCAEQINQSGRSACKSGRISRLPTTQAMCHVLREYHQSDPDGFDTVHSSDTQIISPNISPCTRKTLVDITSNMSKMIKYHHFSKRGSERQSDQNIDECENLAQQTVDRFASGDRLDQSGDQVNIAQPNFCGCDGEGTLTTNVVEDLDVSSKKQDKSGASAHPKSFMTSENLLSCRPFGNCGAVDGNLKSNVAKHLDVLEHELHVLERAAIDDGQIVSSCDNKFVSMEDTNDLLGACDRDAVFRGCYLEELFCGRIADSGNGFVHEEQNRNVSCYPENYVTDTNTIHEITQFYVGSPVKAECGNIEKGLASYPNCSQRMETFHDPGSTDDRKERTQVTSVLHRNSAMIICNSEYDVEFVPLTDAVDASDLESTADETQRNIMDVDMSPCVHNCSQESGGFEMYVLTDPLSPSIGEQHYHPVDTAGLTQECKASKNSIGEQHYHTVDTAGLTQECTTSKNSIGEQHYHTVDTAGLTQECKASKNSIGEQHYHTVDTAGLTQECKASKNSIGEQHYHTVDTAGLTQECKASKNSIGEQHYHTVDTAGLTQECKASKNSIGEQHYHPVDTAGLTQECKASKNSIGEQHYHPVDTAGLTQECKVSKNSIGEQHYHTVDTPGLTQECTASKNSADSVHAANAWSVTVLETQPFEVTAGLTQECTTSKNPAESVHAANVCSETVMETQPCEVTAGLTQECTTSKNPAESVHAANVCSETVMETQPFEVTTNFEIGPTELEDCYKATIPTHGVSAAQAAECKQVNIIIVSQLENCCWTLSC